MFYGMPGGCQAPTRSQDNSSYKAQESVHSNEALPENCRQQNLDSTQPSSGDGKQCPALNAVHYCLSLRGRRLSPQKKASKVRVLHSNIHHSRYLDLHDRGRGGFSALSFSYRKSPQKSCSQNKGGVAWMTLDGLLVNVDEAISSEMGKILGHQETVAWNGFAPLQKVLLVAITAAAASAAKQRHTEEMRRLQLALDARDKDSEILREKISQLQEHLSFWKEQAQKFCDGMEATRKVIPHKRVSPLFKLGLESTPKCDSTMLEQFATPQTEQELVRKPDHIAHFKRALRAASFEDLGGRFSKESWNLNAAEDNNEKRTFMDRLSESPSLVEGQLTPQMPLTELNKIFTPSNNVSPKQIGRLSRYCRKGCRRVDVIEDSLMSRVPSTQLILQLKEQISGSQRTVNENCRQIDKKDERLPKEADQSFTTSRLNCSKINEGDNTKVDSAIQVAVRNTVDTLLAPLSGRHHFVNHTWPSDMVIEQLLGELENAAAKVASMEAEIKSLRDSEMLCERKKEEAERHLAEVRLNLDMISRRRVLQSEDSMFQDFTQSEQSGFHTCKELETTLVSLKDTEKRLASCREACEKKDKAISRLEDEVAALQAMVSELRFLQATPKVVGQQDPSPVQTFLTSNLLFNLDSPVKIDSPLSAKSSLSSWKGLDELSRVSDSMERESRESTRGSCDSEVYRLECVRGWQIDENKEEPECITSVLQIERATTNKQAIIRQTAEESRRTRSNGEVRRSNSSTDELIRRSNSSSSTDESSSGPLRQGRWPQIPKSYSSHARKLKFSNAADFRFPEDNGRRMPSPVEAGGDRRDDGSLSNKASNVLAGVEPNTPMKDRKFNGSGKDKNLSHHSLDSLNKAKENFAHRRRWI